VDEVREDRDGHRDQAEISVKNGCDTLAAMAGSRVKSLILQGPAGLIVQKPYNTRRN
jgi:hypothetical protein